MNIQPHGNISSARAMDLINDGLPLVDVYVNGNILISGENNWNKEIIIQNCIIDCVDINCSTFKTPIRLINTHFKDCRFIFSFFLQGFTIENCVFDKYLDFQSGGHNQIGHPVIIRNNSFSDFVNFFDCWYMGDVYITNNIFHKGSNIQSINQYLTFDIPPIIAENVGQINIEAESA
ncbi:MAG: hypothetical protein JWQ66_3097 [Mucilaginibacter sp.]|nr:hypothetical protein [Mucilaginibacter sp.]